MCATNFKKRFMMALSLSVCVLLCGCQVLFPGEHTELVVDGEYKPFNVPRKTMEKLMELVGAEDVDYIYEVFSPAVRESTEGLHEQIQQFIRFSKEDVTSWEFITGIGDAQRIDSTISSTRSSIYDFHTNCGTYSCVIGEVLKSTSDEKTVGFSSIKIYPIELFNEYGSINPSSIYIVYRVGDQPANVSLEPYPMETLMQLTAEGNADNIYEMFSLTAKENAKGLQEKIFELIDLLNGQGISWEPYTWTQITETVDGIKVTTQEMFFYLHTNAGLYRCDIREVLESTNQEDVGFSSISIFPALYPGEEPEYEDDVYKGYCTWGRENMGISIVYQQEN